jgi:ABC-type transporter Mla MlaB component
LFEDEKMAHNFKIKLHKKAENMHIHLMGDFDGNSALELVNSIKDNVKNSQIIKIDTKELKKIYPFGQVVFNRNLTNIKDRQTRIEFTGKNASQIVEPDGL